MNVVCYLFICRRLVSRKYVYNKSLSCNAVIDLIINNERIRNLWLSSDTLCSGKSAKEEYFPLGIVFN